MGTVTLTLTLDLPEEIAEKAERFGILESKSIVRLLEAEIERQRRIDHLFETLDLLQSDPNRLTPEEIDEEIRLYREEKRAKREQALATPVVAA